MANKAFKYRIYPTTEQQTLFAQTFGCCRKVWNLMLSDKQAYYQKTGTILHTTPAQYKDTYPYLRDVDSLALANVQFNLQSAYKNCYSDHNAEPPKFKVWTTDGGSLPVSWSTSSRREENLLSTLIDGIRPARTAIYAGIAKRCR